MKILAIGYALMHDRQWKMFESIDAEVHIITPHSWPNQTVKPRDHKNLHFHFCNDYLHFNANTYFIPAVKKYIKELKPDIVYSFAEPWSFSALYNEFAARKYDVPHITVGWENLLKPFPFPFSWIEKYIIKNVEGIVAGNPQVVEIYRMKGATCSMITSPGTGFNSEPFLKERGNLRKKLGMQGKKVILYTGRVVPEKGIMHVLESVETVCKKVKNAHFLINGWGPMLPKVRKYARENNLEDKVTILDGVAREDVPKLYRTSDVFVYPSYRRRRWAEQFGFGIVEPMACGVPVITTYSGAIPWTVSLNNSIEKAALLVEPRSTESLSKGIISVLTDTKLRKKMIANGKIRVKETSSPAAAKIQGAFIKKVIENYKS
jgi:glycosyltransferase involved in cell wall biosynthesis